MFLLKNSRYAKLEENVNFEAKESSSRCVGERRFIMDRIRSSHPFGSQREVAGQREVRRVRDVQNSEGRIQGAGGGREGGKQSEQITVHNAAREQAPWSPFVISIG